jgi:hypothetical protein
VAEAGHQRQRGGQLGLAFGQQVFLVTGKAFTLGTVHGALLALQNIVGTRVAAPGLQAPGFRNP